MAKRKRKHTIRNTLIYLSVILALSALAYVNRQVESFLSEKIATFELKDIKIHGNKILTHQQVLHLCGVKPGEKYLKIKAKKIAQRLMRSPFVKSATAVYSLPATLHITIIERQPIAFVWAKKLILVDEEGRLLPFPKIKDFTWDLPLIYGIHKLGGQIGEKSHSEKLIKAIEVLKYVKFLQSPLWSLIAGIDLKSPEMLEISLIRGGAKVRCNFQNYQDELYVLSMYVQNYLNWDQLADIEYIDLRFNDRLILKNRKKQG